MTNVRSWSLEPVTQRFDFSVADVPVAAILILPPNGMVATASAILSGPVTSVKEQVVSAYAHALACRGIASLIFDHRTFGESGGEPRQFENPLAKIEEIREAASALLTKMPASLTLFGIGICAGAGYMARAIAEDRRFDGFAGIAGFFGTATGSLSEPSPSIARGLAAEARWKATGKSETIAAVGPQGGDAAMPLTEAYEYYGTPRGAAPNYINAHAVQLLDYSGPFDSQGAAEHIRVPSLIIHSEKALAPSFARRFVSQLKARRREL